MARPIQIRLGRAEPPGCDAPAGLIVLHVEEIMLKTVISMSFGVALCFMPFSTHAQTGYGVKRGLRLGRLSTGHGTTLIKARRRRAPERLGCAGTMPVHSVTYSQGDAALVGERDDLEAELWRGQWDL